MTVAPVDELDDFSNVHPGVLAAIAWNAEHHQPRDLAWLYRYWLGAQNLRTTMIRLGFSDHDEHKLIVEAVAAIARGARRERHEHRKTGLAKIQFEPEYSPPASSGLPPTISAGDLMSVLASARTIRRLRKHTPKTLTSDALARCDLFVRRLIAEHPI